MEFHLVYCLFYSVLPAHLQLYCCGCRNPCRVRTGCFIHNRARFSWHDNLVGSSFIWTDTMCWNLCVKNRGQRQWKRKRIRIKVRNTERQRIKTHGNKSRRSKNSVGMWMWTQIKSSKMRKSFVQEDADGLATKTDLLAVLLISEFESGRF